VIVAFVPAGHFPVVGGGVVGSGVVELVVGSGVVELVVGSGVVELVVGSGVVELVVGSGVVELVVGSGVVELVVGSGVVELVVGSGVVELVVGSGVVELVVGSGVVELVVGSGVVELVVGSGVVELVVGSGVVELVVGSGAVEDVVSAKTHGPPAGPIYPVLQVHALTSVLPKGDCECAGQSTHTYADSATPADASGSSSSRRPVPTHGPPTGPVKPALHVHALCDVLPNGECEFGGQGVHGFGVKPVQVGFDAHS
jgi:hypothetical protein